MTWGKSHILVCERRSHGLRDPPALTFIPPCLPEGLWTASWKHFPSTGYLAGHALMFGGLPASPVLSSLIGVENAQESTKEEGRSAGGCERDSPPPASSMCAREALSVPGSAPTQRTCQLFRSPFSLEAELKNKLQLMGVLKRSVTSCSAYFFVPCFTGGGKEVGTRGMALLLSIKVHVAKARHSQFEGKTACCCDCQSVLHLTHVTPEVP